ncbi:hypothetical protein Bca52824_058211 [Brassica carinata]|uniref:Ubiquitin-like protease family profile domain-containing protein n=1 Tax=Brassica carinata TaxID=52824 RepID=A0A8X7UFG4_BRACI|nr:hypothetical protein Bca52824_058211 [Brassica carinata]
MKFSRLVEFPEDVDDEVTGPLPEMMFAEGEEPVGVRVLTYQSSRAINTILKALDNDEIQHLRKTSFRKLVEIAEKPGFSGRFARYLLSRQLKVEKKHEAWFRFAGKPIIFSLREFAIVTGLPCGEFPKKSKSKKKKNINEKPYWPEIFGRVEEMRVSRAVKMLRKKTVTDKDIRMKLACLAISYSDDDDADRHATKTKKKTLSPGHAQEVDRKAEAMMTSIIPPDPARPVNESLVKWSDDVVDAKVENLVRIISRNQVIRKEMIRGGVSKVDVDRMRENKQKDVPVDQTDKAKMKSLINSVLRPEIDRIDGTIAAAVASVKEVSTSGLAYQSSVIATVDAMLRNFKTEILSCFPKGFPQPPVEAVHPTPVADGGAIAEVPTNRSPPAADGVATRDVPQYSTPAMRGSNEEIVDDVMGNLSHFSTPPRFRKTGSEAQSRRHRSQKSIGRQAAENMHVNVSPRLQSQKPTSAKRLSLLSGSVDCLAGDQAHKESLSAQNQTHESRRENIPSFSLCLTQELRTVQPADIVVLGENNKYKKPEDDIEPEASDTEDSLICRKSKRLRHVPPQLIIDYQCGPVILNRAREEQLYGSSDYDSSEICEKYTRLKMLLKKECVINVGSLSVTGKDLIDIGERNGFLPGRVVDILTRLVASNFMNQALGRGDTTTVFLDSRLQCLLSRNYPRIKKSKSKEAYVFSKAMVDLVSKSYSKNTHVARFYIPFNVDRKHWVGLFVNIQSSKIFVLDCNTGVIMDEALVKELLPISNMFPYLLKHIGNVEQPNGNEMVVERMKGLS